MIQSLLAVALAALLPHSHQDTAPPENTRDRVVLVRSTGNLLVDGPRFAEALCASGVGGRPACLLVGDELTPAQVDLLERLPDVEVVSVGEPPEGAASRVARRVEEPVELFEVESAAVVTSLHIADVIEAAAEAYRRGVPLLRGEGIASHVERLGIEKVWRVAPRQHAPLPEGLDVEVLDDPAARWAAVCADESEPYLAVANAFPGRSWTTGSFLAATLLAARHRGMLLALEEPVTFRYAVLREREVAPPGLEEVKAKGWLVGDFETEKGALGVAVPQTSVGPGIGGLVPKYGRPFLDLDFDDRFDAETEEIEVGTVARVGEVDSSVSLRLTGALGKTKFFDGQRTERAVALSPPAEAIAARLVRLYESGSLPANLLLAGDHRELPFDYVEDPVYAKQFMHEQELASDNLYADPDGDGYLDLPVGRFVAPDVIQATTLATRLSTYDVWSRTTADEDGARFESCLVYPAWEADEADLGIPSIFASFELALVGMGLDLERAGFANHMHLREAGALDEVHPNLMTSSLITFAHHSGPEGWQFRVVRQGSGIKNYQMVSPRCREIEPPARTVPFLAGAPLIIGAGCDSAGLDYEVTFENSIVHAFFEQGAIGYLGNTRAGFPDTEEYLLRHAVQGMLGLLPYPREPVSVGEAFRLGKNFLAFLVEERGPFQSVFPFWDYSHPMRREWTSLVYYGDPALKLRLPEGRGAPPIQVREWPDGDATIELKLTAEPQSFPIWIPKVVGFGPIAEITGITAPGLTYGSVPWATFKDAKKPGPVGPGVFLDLPVPDGLELGGEASTTEAPDWALGGARLVTNARGERRLLVSVDVLRYAMADGESLEIAETVELAFQ